MSNEELVSTRYLVRVANCDQEIEVTAAYVQTGGDTIHSIGSSNSESMICLKDTAHKVVFQAPALCVAYVRRADSTTIRGYVTEDA